MPRSTRRQRAYCPYSNFPVGAALRTASGKIYQGVQCRECLVRPDDLCRARGGGGGRGGRRARVRGDRRRQPRRRVAVRRLPAIPGRVQPEPADRDGRLARARAKVHEATLDELLPSRFEGHIEWVVTSHDSSTVGLAELDPPYVSFFSISASARPRSLDRRVLLFVLEPAVVGEGVVGLGDGDLVRQHQHADVAEDRPHVDQAAEAAEPAGRRAHQRRHFALVAPRAALRPAPGRETQSIVFFNSGVIELLYSGQEINRPSCSRNSFFSATALAGQALAPLPGPGP